MSKSQNKRIAAQTTNEQIEPEEFAEKIYDALDSAYLLESQNKPKKARVVRNSAVNLIKWRDQRTEDRVRKSMADTVAMVLSGGDDE